MTKKINNRILNFEMPSKSELENLVLIGKELTLTPQDASTLTHIARFKDSPHFKDNRIDTLLETMSEKGRHISDILLHPTTHNQSEIAALECAREFHRWGGGSKEVEDQMVRRAIDVQTGTRLGLKMGPKPKRHMHLVSST